MPNASSFNTLTEVATGSVTWRELGNSNFGLLDSLLDPSLATRTVLVGAYSTIPASGIAGRLFLSSDTLQLFVDTGAFWYLIASPRPIINSSVSLTLVLSHARARIRLNAAGAIVVTVPLNSAVAFPVGTEILISRIGVGAVSVAATTGVTINASSLSIANQYGAATITKVGTDEWDLN
jgi:hypothetical protein